MAATRAVITMCIISHSAASIVQVLGHQASELVKGHGIGHQAPLNEEGYRQVVAAGKGDEDMKTFILRVLDANDHIADDDSLNGLVPYYSGGKAVQSYGVLIEELKDKNWLGSKQNNTATGKEGETTTSLNSTAGKDLKARPSEANVAQEGVQVEHSANMSTVSGALNKSSKRNSQDASDVSGRHAAPVSFDVKRNDLVALKKTPHASNLSEPELVNGSTLSALRENSSSKNASQVNATHAVKLVKRDSVSAAERARLARLKAEQEREREERERAKRHTLSLKGQARAAVEQSYIEARSALVPATQTVSSASTEAQAAAADATAMARKKAVAPAALRRSELTTAKLPEVEALLAPASNKFLAFQAQAQNLKEQVAARYAASRAAAEQRKKQYELALAETSRNSHAIATANQRLEKHIASMLASNAQIKHQADTFLKAKGLLRETMDGIVSKLALAKDFLSDSVNITDDSAAEVLQVLRPTTPAPTLEHFLGLARQSLDQKRDEALHHDAFASLLEIGSETGTKFGRNPLEEEEKKPDSISEVLSDRLSELGHHQEVGVAELDSKYNLLLAKANASQVALLEKQSSLNSTLTSLQQLESNLTSARDFLHTQVRGLGERLRGFGTFANRIHGSLTSLVQSADSKIEGVHLSASLPAAQRLRHATPATKNSH